MRPNSSSKRSLIVGGVALLVAAVFVLRSGGSSRAQADSGAAALETQESLHDIAARLTSIERDSARRERGSVDPALLREIVSQAVSDEMRSQPAKAAAPAQAEATRTESPANVSRQATAYDTGRSLLDARLAAGLWRTSDAREIRNLMIVMTAERREQLMSELAMAINRQELKDEAEGLSF